MILYSEEILQRALAQLKKKEEKEEKKPEKPVVCKGGDVESVLRSIFDFDADRSKYICIKPEEFWDILRSHKLDKTRDGQSIENFLRNFSIKFKNKSNNNHQLNVDGRLQTMIFMPPFVDGVELPRWIKADEIRKRKRLPEAYRTFMEYKKNLNDTLKKNKEKILSYNLPLHQACLKFLSSIGFKSFKGYTIRSDMLRKFLDIPDLKEIFGVNTEDPIEILKRNRQKILRRKGLLSKRCIDILNESGCRTKKGVKWSYNNINGYYSISQLKETLNIYD